MSLSNIKQVGAAALVLATLTSFSSVAYAQDTSLGIKVYLEGAANGATTAPMRTDLWTRNLLDTNVNPQPAQQPCAGVAPLTINANAFSSGSEPVDWVCIELRDSVNSGVSSARVPGVLLANGYVVSSDNSLLVVDVDQSRQYHVVVHHRSHLSGASDIASVIPGTPGLLFQDLTTQSANVSPFFGANLKQISGINYMYAGDANEDVFIDGGDVNFWRNGNGSSYVYRTHDTNLDGDITGADRLLIDSNLNTFHYIP